MRVLNDASTFLRVVDDMAQSHSASALAPESDADQHLETAKLSAKIKVAEMTREVENMLVLNMTLGHKDAAKGVLELAARDLDLPIKESWHEQLTRWEDALTAYEAREIEELLLKNPESDESRGRARVGSGTIYDDVMMYVDRARERIDWTAARMRCLNALGEWGALS